MDKRLKKIIFYQAATALFSVIIISGALLSEKYVTTLSDTLNQFQILRINSIKMKDATKNMRATSLSAMSIIPLHYKPEELEGAILSTLDSIKARMKDVSLTVANFDRKSNEITLPVTIRGSIRDYGDFLHNIGYLQSLVSPFFFIDSLSMVKSTEETKEEVVFAISGLLKIQSPSIDRANP